VSVAFASSSRPWSRRQPPWPRPGSLALGRVVLGRTLGGALGLLDGGLLGDGLADELDDRHGGVVALAGTDLRDAGVAAVALGHVGPDLDEETVHDALVADDRHHPATGVQVTALREGDEALGQGAQALGLGLRGGDGVVLEERGREGSPG
jgi:hypothetical protein